MLKKIALGTGSVILVLAIVIATRPAKFHIERSQQIAAAPSEVFAEVSDFHAWRAWSPYEKLDPTMTRTFTGATAGMGAKYAWAGNNKIGEGRMTIEKAEPASKLSIRLEFIKPFQAVNTATFRFVPSGAGTTVTWAMDGENNFFGKAISLFVGIDELVGTDFERGLSALKGVVENKDARAPSLANASP